MSDEKQLFDDLVRKASSGDARAQTSVGYLYSNGIATAPNPIEAVRWYERAAEQGEPAAQFNLAVCFEMGRGVARNIDTARMWYERASERGDDGAAEYNLAMIYLDGKLDSGPDVATAVKWLKAAARKLNKDAQFAMGSLLASGDRVPSDYAAALEWFKAAARQDDPDAALALGYMFEHGQGVHQDLDVALHWYRRASELGKEAAIEAVKELEHRD